MKGNLALILVVLILFFSISPAFIIEGNKCYCDSCMDCTEALASFACPQVSLTQNIRALRENCVFISYEKEFSCEGNTIASPNGNPFFINSPNMKVRDCGVEGPFLGIKINKEDVTFENLKVINSDKVFLVENTKGCFFQNISFFNVLSPIIINNSKDCYLNNLAIFSTEKGIIIENSSNISIGNLTVGEGIGIVVQNSREIRIAYSEFTSSGVILNGENLTISFSKFKENEVAIKGKVEGLKIENSSFNNNTVGIELILSKQIEVSNNYFGEGIALKLEKSYVGEVYNNIFNTTYPIFITDNSRLYWNTTKRKGENIVKLPVIGGNVWLTNNFSNSCIDENQDFICDRAFIINEKNADYLPLITKKDGSPPNISFVLPTPENNSKILGMGFEISVKAEDESGVDRIILEIFSNNTALQIVCEGNECNRTFIAPEKGNYFIRATAFDKYENARSTETRVVYVEEEQEVIAYSSFYELIIYIVILILIALIGKLLYSISKPFLKEEIEEES